MLRGARIGVTPLCDSVWDHHLQLDRGLGAEHPTSPMMGTLRWVPGKGGGTHRHSPLPESSSAVVPEG